MNAAVRCSCVARVANRVAMIANTCCAPLVATESVSCGMWCVLPLQVDGRGQEHEANDKDGDEHCPRKSAHAGGEPLCERRVDLQFRVAVVHEEAWSDRVV